MFHRNTGSSLSLSWELLIFIPCSWTHKDKTVIPEIWAPVERKAPLSFSKLSTAWEKKIKKSTEKCAEGCQIQSVTTVFMQTPSGFKACVSWNRKHLCWMVKREWATIWIALVRLSVFLLDSQLLASPNIALSSCQVDLLRVPCSESSCAAAMLTVTAVTDFAQDGNRMSHIRAEPIRWRDLLWRAYTPNDVKVRS